MFPALSQCFFQSASYCRHSCSAKLPNEAQIKLKLNEAQMKGSNTSVWPVSPSKKTDGIPSLQPLSISYSTLFVLSPTRQVLIQRNICENSQMPQITPSKTTPACCVCIKRVASAHSQALSESPQKHAINSLIRSELFTST